MSELKIQFTTKADTSGAQATKAAVADVTKALEKQTAAATQAAEAWFQQQKAIADANAKKLDQLEKGKGIKANELGQHAAGWFVETDAMRRNAEMVEKVGGAKKDLLKNLKVLKHELHNLPGMWHILAVAKNPAVAAALAIGAALAYVREKIAKLKEEAGLIKTVEDFFNALESGSVKAAALQRDSAAFVDSLREEADAAGLAAMSFETLNRALAEEQRLKNELEDVRLAREFAEIEADPSLSGAGKSAAKQAAQDRSRARKRETEGTAFEQGYSGALFAASGARKTAAALADQLPSLDAAISASDRKTKHREAIVKSVEADMVKQQPLLEKKIESGTWQGDTSGLIAAENARQELQDLRDNLANKKNAWEKAQAETVRLEAQRAAVKTQIAGLGTFATTQESAAAALLQTRQIKVQFQPQIEAEQQARESIELKRQREEEATKSAEAERKAKAAREKEALDIIERGKAEGNPYFQGAALSAENFDAALSDALPRLTAALDHAAEVARAARFPTMS